MLELTEYKLLPGILLGDLYISLVLKTTPWCRHVHLSRMSKKTICTEGYFVGTYNIISEKQMFTYTYNYTYISVITFVLIICANEQWLEIWNLIQYSFLSLIQQIFLEKHGRIL